MNGNKIHGVLVSKILVKDSNGKSSISYNNRDMNGCKNIRKIVRYGLSNGLERPYWFRRNVKLDDKKNNISHNNSIITNDVKMNTRKNMIYECS